MPKRLAIIDGHALAFRAFHALREAGLRASSGEPTYAVYGFAQIMLTMLHEQRPEYLVVAFDVGRTFRDDLYSEYKAGRAETPEEFHPQLARIQQLVTALNIPIYTAEGFEADDVIGTLARQASAAGVATLILTGDTDTLQLVDDHVSVLLANPFGGRTGGVLPYDREKVIERYKGLGPHQLADLRGLKGDTSDNIPGVKGIGEKGAIDLLNQFGTVEGIYDNLALIPNRYRSKLEDQRDAALFSKKLATIVCDVPVALDLEQAAIGGYRRSEVIRLFQELEIGATSNLIKKLPPNALDGEPEPEAAPAPSPAPAASAPLQPSLFAELPANLPLEGPSGASQLSLFGEAPAPAAQPTIKAAGEYRLITTPAALDELIAELRAAPSFAFDSETSGLRPFASELIGLSFSTAPGRAAYLPLGHTNVEQLPRETALSALRDLFEDPARPRFAHNAKFDLEVLQHAGIAAAGVAFDTMIAAALLGKRPGLKELAFNEGVVSEPLTPIETLIGRGSKQVSFAEVPLELALPYAAADADMTMRLVHALQPQIEADSALNNLFQRLEMPLINVLVGMEAAGISVDIAYLRELGERVTARIAEIEAEIHGLAGEPFNINSTAQLAEVLFQRLGISDEGVGKTAKTKQYSLTAEVFEQIRDRHPIFELILHYRQLSKLKSTYIDALPELVNPQTGRIHTSYNQVGAATGRLSSDSPNLQNIPVRTEEGREIRGAFRAAPGHKLIAADYSQIELRVLAHFTEDPELLRVFREGDDVHAATAAQLFGVPPNEVDKNQRRIAKTVVFGVIYGISAFGLSQRLGLERSESQALINQLFARFPGLRSYIDTTLANGKQAGYVSTLFGRRRAMGDLSALGPRRAAAEREAINAPIQGTAADLMKIAMIRLAAALREAGLATRMLLQVHDELILEAPEAEVETACRLVREVMEAVYPELAVPLGVEVEIGSDWAHMRR